MATTKKTGRPTVYKKEYIRIAEKLARLGATNPDIAEALGVAVSSVSLWMTKYQDFSDAIKNGRQEKDTAVERSLHEMATGYQHRVEKPMVVNGAVEIVEYTESIPPNPTAMIFWLKNRKPKDWRDKQEVEHSGGVTVVIDQDDAKLI